MHDLIRRAGQIIAQKRVKNAEISRARKAEIYQKIPQIQALDAEMASVVKEVVNALAAQREHAQLATEQIAQTGRALAQKKRQLLEAGGFAADYLDPLYDCVQCQDEGYLPNGQRCQCFKRTLIDLAYQDNDLRTKLTTENFDSFQLNLFSDQPVADEAISQRQNMVKNAEVATAFIANFKSDNAENLLFYGPTGQGKTFLCSCIAKSLIDREYHVIYQTAYKLFETIKSHRFADDALSTARYRLLTKCDLLIVDDLGTELINTFTNAELFNLINARLLERKKTIISTNLNPETLSEHYGARIFSRLAGHYKMLRFFGEDIRY